MMANVLAALRGFGRRNDGTPLLIASTPVNAVQPEANARIASSSVNTPPTCVVRCSCCCAVLASGRLPVTPLTKPYANIRKVSPMNKYVGTAKARPDSRTPRRFASISSATHATDNSTACRCRLGAALVMATTPDTTDTATVIT